MTDASGNNIDQLIAALGSKNSNERVKARKALAEIGSPAVSALQVALKDPHQHIRWESAKALAQIADPAAADSLVAALADRDSDVRWVAGAALIALGRDALKPLLTPLTKSDPPDGMYQSAHHVLHDLLKDDDLASIVGPVLKAFDEPEPGVAIPVAAAEALHGGDV